MTLSIAARRPLCLLLLASVIALALVACGKSDEPELPALSDESGLLQYVPAESPYVIARLEPMPPAYRERVEAQQAVIDELNREIIEDIPGERGDDATASDAEVQQALALIRQLSVLGTPEGMREAGVSPDAGFVIYGNQATPVLRVELEDAVKFEARLLELTEAMGIELSMGKLGDVTYHYFNQGVITVAAMIRPSQAVLSVMPPSLDDAQRRVLLGLDLPAENIAASGALVSIAREHGFLDNFIGFIDVQRMTSLALEGGGNAVDSALEDMAGPAGTDTLSEVCREEILEMSTVAPRTVMGLTRADATGVQSKLVVELREDLATQLADLESPVPGLGIFKAGLMSFGMSLDAEVLHGFVKRRLESLSESPYECELLQAMNPGINQALDVMQRQPLPPTARDFNGFLVAIDAVSGFRPGVDVSGIEVAAGLLLSIDNPESLLAFGNMFVPEIAALQLKPDSSVVPVATDRLGPDAGEAWMSMSKTAIGAASGAGGDERLAALMTLPPNPDSPLLYFDMDLGGYLELVRDMTSMMEPSSDSEAEMQARVSGILDALDDLYDRATVDVRMTDKGVEVSSTATLAR